MYAGGRIDMLYGRDRFLRRFRLAGRNDRKFGGMMKVNITGQFKRM